MTLSSEHWLIWAILSAVFAALTGLFAKVGIQGVNPDYATLLCTMMLVVILMPLVMFTGKWSNPFALSSRVWIFLALSALATGASWICYYRALKLGDVAQVVPVDKASIVLAVVFAVAFLRERPSVQEWFGIGLITAGVLTMVVKIKWW